MRMVAHGEPADESDPEGVEAWAWRMSPPDNEIPAIVGMAPLVLASDDAAVAITGIAAYSNGFRFSLAVRLRRRRPDAAPRGLMELVDPHMPAGGAGVDERLLLGLEYSDGRRTSTLDAGFGGLGPTGGDRLVLMQNGGSGAETSFDETYWVAPLPPDGPVAFIVSWSAFGVPESRLELDGGAILVAASRSRTLWPPQRVESPPEPTPPARPTSGWFAQPPS